jgi:hypothetical protein
MNVRPAHVYGSHGNKQTMTALRRPPSSVIIIISIIIIIIIDSLQTETNRNNDLPQPSTSTTEIY